MEEMQSTSPQPHAGERISVDEIKLKHPSFSSRFIAVLHETVREAALRDEAFDLDKIFDCRIQADGQLWINYSVRSKNMVLRIPANYWIRARNYKIAAIVGGIIWSMSQTYDRSEYLKWES